MNRRFRLGVVGCALALVPVLTSACQARGAYQTPDTDPQRAMDSIRKKHAKEIVALILEYANKTGHFPFAQEASEKSFMVLIGHSPSEEDAWAGDPTIARGGRFTNASMLEARLSKELGRPIALPRDPQKVATYAPNVYVYFIAGDQMTVAVHLSAPAEDTVPYEWRGGRFYSYTIAYEPNK
jgi:hypothetical protein